MPDFTGQSTGRYHIIEPLGQGGMAVVYKAYDTSLDIDVAIKFIRTERLSPEIAEKSLKRFKIEAQKTAKLMHPNIIPVTDYGDFNGVPFLVMRYIEGGKTLKSMLGKQIPWQEAVQTILPIAEALDYAHKNHIIHRDVKPANILITKDGIPMLSDFGIAKVIEEEETLDGLTTAGMAIGTPEYMAPEQWEGKKVDGRADIYALGVVLYEMITGRPPFKADTIPATMVQVLRDPLPRPKQFVRDLPDRVEKVIITALSKTTENRYSSMADFVIALKKMSITDSTRHLKSSSEFETKKLPISKQKIIGFSLGGIIVLTIIIGLTNGWFRKETANSQPDETETTLGVGSTMISSVDGMTLVFVPAGEFSMGSPDEIGDDDEHPQHQVYLDAFWIDRTEVTNNAYQACVNSGNCTNPSDNTTYYYIGNPTFDDYPVNFVNWLQAREYCRWVTGDLPTEAQWEKAARGTDGRLYPWGNELPNSTLAAFGNSQTIYSLSSAYDYVEGQSPYGAINMAGNVAEWTLDWYGEYTSEYQIDPTGNQNGDFKVFRSGSFKNTAELIRSASRQRIISNAQIMTLGFRCVLPVK